MRELWTGIFVVGGILIGVWVYVFMINYSSHRNGYTIYAVCDNAGGLNERHEIRYKGVEVGYVKNVKIVKNKVLITAYISDEIKLHKPAYATIEDLSMIGGSRVLCLHSSDDTTSDIVMAGDTIRAIRTSLWQDISNLSMTIKNVLNEGKWEEIVGLIESMRKSIASLKEGLDVGSDVKRVVNRTDSLVMRIDRIMDKIENGEGSIGRAVYEDSLYDNLIKVLSDIDTLVSDIKENPERYIKIKLFK